LIKVSFDKLEEAFLNSSDEISYWLDKKMGKVIFISSEFLDDAAYFEEKEELQAAREILMMCGDIENGENIEIDENRYLEIISPNSNENYKIMEEFTVFQVENERLQNKLTDALRGRKPFRRFKDVLIYEPDTEKKWFEFEAKKLREYIEDWAESEKIEIDFADDK